jgi:hypothetical protein
VTPILSSPLHSASFEKMAASLYTGTTTSIPPTFVGSYATMAAYAPLPEVGCQTQAAFVPGSDGQPTLTGDYGFVWDDELFSLWTNGGITMG